MLRKQLLAGITLIVSALIVGACAPAPAAVQPTAAPPLRRQRPQLRRLSLLPRRGNNRTGGDRQELPESAWREWQMQSRAGQFLFRK